MIQTTRYLALISAILMFIGMVQLIGGLHSEEPALGAIGLLILAVGFGTYIGFSTSWLCEEDKKKK